MDPHEISCCSVGRHPLQAPRLGKTALDREPSAVLLIQAVYAGTPGFTNSRLAPASAPAAGDHRRVPTTPVAWIWARSPSPHALQVAHADAALRLAMVRQSRIALPPPGQLLATSASFTQCFDPS